jgi:GAF domain-containing protein
MAAEPLRAFADVANALGATFGGGGDELVDCIARTARAVFGATACSIALLTPDDQELVFTTASGGAEANVSGLRMPAAQGIAGWVATTGQPLAVSDLTHDPRFATDVASATGYIPAAILACPIETDVRLLGVIEILDRDPLRAGSDSDLQLLALFARQAALALDATDRSRRIGSLVLEALAAAADGDVAAAFTVAARTAASAADPEAEADGLAEIAAAFARLAKVGAAERALAVRLLDDISGYAAPRAP